MNGLGSLHTDKVVSIKMRQMPNYDLIVQLGVYCNKRYVIAIAQRAIQNVVKSSAVLVSRPSPKQVLYYFTYSTHSCALSNLLHV